MVCNLWQIAKYFRRVAAERDNVFVKILPDVGHCPHDDRPELAAGEILPFLENYNFWHDRIVFLLKPIVLKTV